MSTQQLSSRPVSLNVPGAPWVAPAVPQPAPAVAACPSRHRRRQAWLPAVLTVLAVAQPASDAGAGIASWAEGSGGDDGATRDFYNQAAYLAWAEYMGDWVDAKGNANGDAAYARADVPRGRVDYVEMDVTDLVRAWTRGEVINEGFMLVCDGTVKFSTRESDDPPPQLVIERDGARTTWEATADTELNASTHRSLGSRPLAQCSGSGSRVLIRFDTAELAGLDAATLRVWSPRQYANVTRVKVFPVVTAAAAQVTPREAGIAAAYDGDRGLERHPDVLLVENFDDDRWVRAHGWSDGGYGKGPVPHRVVGAEYAGFGFEGLAGAALEVTLRQGTNMALNASWLFAQNGREEPDDIYLRYYLRFGSDWAPRRVGGKLPGIAGTYVGTEHAGGWGGRTSRGTNGWSARGLFDRVGPPGNPVAGRTPIGTYLYHAGQAGSYGDLERWLHNWDRRGLGGLIENGRWVCVEVHVRLNDPGEENGLVEGWIDGFRAYRRAGLTFRAPQADYLHIDRIWMNVYHGGTVPAEYDQHLFLDNVVIARRYVGPLGGDRPAALPGGISAASP